MHENSELLEQYQEMRRAAERKAAMSPEVLHAMSPEEFIHTIHELQVHQIELDMQNENLRAVHSQLAAAEARYFDLYDLAPVGYLSVSKEGLILESNLTADTLLGVPRSALNKRPLSQFILKDDQDIYYRHRKQLFETSAPQQCELRMLKGGEKLFWARLEETLGTERGGAPVCRLVLSDITERKRASDALDASEKRFRELSELLPDIIMEVDCNKIYRWANQAGVNFFGEGVIGKEAAFYFEGEETVYCTVQPLFDGDENVIRVESWQRRKDGEKRLLLWSCRVLKDMQGNVTGALSSARDITERKQAEEKLKTSQERIRQLAQHLETVREEEHTRFADALHDKLGQILTAIKIDLAAVAAECPAEVRLKEKMDGAQKLLSDGILGVHTLCRELRPGALDDLGLKEALDGLTEDWKRRNDMECGFSADIDDQVLTDKIRTAVFRIVQEALTNVSDHAQASKVGINLVADEQALNFSVADNGRGMEPGAADKLESFGLLGMRERLEALGGELHIESSPGKGTRIEGTIPLPQKG